jgi:hypothetical protein
MDIHTQCMQSSMRHIDIFIDRPMTQRTKPIHSRKKSLKWRRSRAKSPVDTTLPSLPALERVMFTLERDDMMWLNTTVAQLKRTRRRTTKSEMVRLGISVLRQRDPDELRDLLRQLD